MLHHRVQRRIAHDAALAHLAGLQLELRFDQHEQAAARRQQRHQRGQHQRERDERQVARHHIKHRRNVHIGALGAAAALNGQRALLAGLGTGRALGLEGLDVLVLGIVAVVVFLVHLPAIAHPAVGRLGLGLVVLFGLDDFGQRQIAGLLQGRRRQRARIHALHADHAQIAAQPVVQLAVTHIHADHLRRAVLQQAVGEPARALPHVEAAQPRHRQAGGPQRPFELEPPARDVFGLGIVEQPHLGHGRNIVTILGNLLPRGQRRQAPLHARSNQPLRLRARGRMAKIHQKNICTHAPILFESKEPLAPVYKAQLAIISGANQPLLHCA